MPPVKQKSYKATMSGILIQDKRQRTNGPITPNYVIDLYLPIIGYEGLGVLTVFYRLTSTSQQVDLNAYARAGGVGFRGFKKRLAILEDCGFLRVHVPKGAERGKHHHTVIEIFDAPTQVPEKYRERVLARTITRWMVQVENDDFFQVSPDISEKSEMSGDTSMEMSGDTSMEMSGDTPIMNVPIRNVPIRNVPTHTDAPDGAGVRARPHVRARPQSIHKKKICRAWAEHLKESGGGIKSPGAYATKIFNSGEDDDMISDWLAGDQRPAAEEQSLVVMIAELRRLHAGDATYQQADLIDDLRFRCQKAGLTWDEPSVRRALNEAGNDLADQNVA